MMVALARLSLGGGAAWLESAAPSKAQTSKLLQPRRPREKGKRLGWFMGGIRLLIKNVECVSKTEPKVKDILA